MLSAKAEFIVTYVYSNSRDAEWRNEYERKMHMHLRTICLAHCVDNYELLFALSPDETSHGVSFATLRFKCLDEKKRDQIIDQMCASLKACVYVHDVSVFTRSREL